MPIVRAIYRSLKQVFETLFADQGSSFRKVGLVEYPSPGMWSIVLISQPPSKDISTHLPGTEEHLGRRARVAGLVERAEHEAGWLVFRVVVGLRAVSRSA